MGLLKTINEQIFSVWSFSWSGLRSKFRLSHTKFWTGRSSVENTLVNYETTRSLYRNDGKQNLGSGFCRPIIDLQVAFIGLPYASVENPNVDDKINSCIKKYWAEEIQQMFRDSLRDSKAIIRLSKNSLDDPLLTMEDREHLSLKIISPEKVSIEYDINQGTIINRAIISHYVEMIEEDFDPTKGEMPKVKEHQILEIVTPEEFQYYDVSEREWLPQLGSINTWGFVPLIEIFNEWDSSINGGQSDLEGVWPFIEAFHDALDQGLQAHKYHSIPKVKFKIKDIATFIRNNFPEAFDPNTQSLKPQATITWKGKEVIFIEADEDIGFVEASSILGDTKTLLEFLFDCICVSSQTPEWAFMRTEIGGISSERSAQTLPFEKKIDRKRNNYQKYIQRLVKMYLVISGERPLTPDISWGEVNIQTALTSSQVLQQLIMGLEVAAQRGIISDDTYRATLRVFLPLMKNTAQEELDAKDNAPLPISSPNGAGNPGNVPVISGQQGKNE